MKAEKQPLVYDIWSAFVERNPAYFSMEMPPSWYFCDNEKDADECAELVKKGIKQATSTSLWWFERNQEKLPEVGNLYIITNWKGHAKAIIKTTKVEKIPYHQITKEYAEIEGEGDKSLEYWRRVHWDYYFREMEPYGEVPTADMIIVCEQFETVWK